MEADHTPRRDWFPLIVRLLIGLCTLVIAQRTSLAICLYGWRHDWPVWLTCAISLQPAIAFAGIFGWLALRNHHQQKQQK